MFTIDQEFHLDRHFVTEMRGAKVPWGGGLLSAATFYDRYSRDEKRSPFGRQESFSDVIQRNIEGVMSIRKTWYHLIGQAWDEAYMQRYGQAMARSAFAMRWLPSGRNLYAMGTLVPKLKGNAALNNCALVEIKSDREGLSHAAWWLMDNCMLGVGVGFSLPSSGFGVQLQRPSDDAWTFVIPDDREGWAESIRLLIRSYEASQVGEKDRRTVNFDYSLLRPYGAPIVTFGGTASGPEPLVQLHERVRRRLDESTEHGFEHFAGTELMVDVMNMIGDCVIAGNVRRSAEIAIGSPRDEVFINLKNYGKWDEETGEMVEKGPYHHRMPWGYLSNNTVRMERDEDFLLLPDLTERILDGGGEPGFWNRIRTEKYGRGLDKVGPANPWLRPDYAVGLNPCGEVPLWNHELCNLVEVFPTRITDHIEWENVLDFATFFASTVALLPSHSPETNKVVAKNRRLGVSLSGIADWMDSTSFSHIHRRLDDGYHLVRKYARQYADDAGVPEPIRVTTIKPSGTVSLLPWVSPGVHHPVKNRFIRRISFRMDSPVADRLISAGVPHEPLATDPGGTWSFQLPMESANRGRTRSVDNVSIFEQCARAMVLSDVWADNAVSFTGVVNKHDKPNLEAAITTTLPRVKSLSFMVNGDQQKQYAQMPYEGITVDEYERRFSAINHDLDWSDYAGTDGQDARFCDGDICAI